jgi:hypothetical protein
MMLKTLPFITIFRSRADAKSVPNFSLNYSSSGYVDYTSFKPWLRDEFALRCVYCLTRERWCPAGHEDFSIEHFIIDYRIAIAASVDSRPVQFEKTVAVQSEPLSGEPPAKLTVIVDRNLSSRYDNIAIDLGTVVDRQVATGNV